MLSELKSSFLIVLFALLLAGCKWVQVDQGRVPQEFLVHAREYVGEYVGNFDGLPGKLVLSLDTDYLRLRFVDGIHNDLL
ncbi:MAG: hypothetical protein AABZ55_15505, partial [Bdellovibrionota bacterium]